jgi:DNA replication and repair protein RecF
MILKSLLLHNFRNYEHSSVSFHPRINTFCGGNGQGKTNLLEAIYLLSTGRSFRTHHLQELILEGKEFFYIEAQIFKDNIDQTLSFYFNGKEKRIAHQKKNSSCFSSLLGLMPSILHAPHDRDLLSGPPSLRRRFLNLHLVQEDPLYIHHLSRFCHSLKQRNFLLKTKNTKTLSAWDEEMALSALYLTEKRSLLVQELNELLPIYLQKLAPDESVYLLYRPSFSISSPTKEKFQELLEKNRAKELHLGSTLIGPHRDDWSLYFRQKNVLEHASEGQKKSFLLALRLSEWKRLSEKFGEPILMNLDDIAIHLDKQREALLEPLLKELSQVFLTSPAPLFEDKDLANTLLIEKGTIRTH